MTEDQFLQLLEGFQNRQLSQDELLAFLNAAGDPHFESMIGEKVYAELVQIRGLQISQDVRADKVWDAVNNLIKEKETTSLSIETVSAPARVHFLKRPLVRYIAAAVLLAGIITYGWMWTQSKQVEKVIASDVAPGRDGAILTLADGSKVVLDSLGNGIITEQSGTQVSLNDGKLSYNSINANSVLYNTMTTPNGRQFAIQLPDGSKAWLNAASSITYPTAFTGNERSVTISGEVYFEVAKDKTRPFTVKAKDNVAIQVLGTSFNVKAYSGDASINTTLLEGSIRLSAFEKFQLLIPGQQTLVKENGTIDLIKNADIQKIMAWKNGLFNFQDESLEEVMKQLERWYDIQVKYIGGPPDKKFFGELGRDLNLSQVTEVLEEVGIKLRIEGRTLFVYH